MPIVKTLLRPILALGLLTASASPVLAQSSGIFSASYNFLKAVKERDFNKAVEAMNSGPTIVNTRDQGNGETALIIVTRDRDAGWMNFLIQNGADVNQRDSNGNTPLMIATEQRFIDGARILVARGARVDLDNRGGETPLIRAVQLKDQSLTRFLIENGADPDKSDSLAGYSARDYAERDGRGTQILNILRTAKKPAAGPATPPSGR